MAFLKESSIFILSSGSDDFKGFVLSRWLILPPTLSFRQPMCPILFVYIVFFDV